MAISDQQREFRIGKLGSSDAPRIMAGRWHELWLEKTGRAESADLSFVPAVQIGIATERLHAGFYAHRTGIPCEPAGEGSFTHPEHTFLVAHPDFLSWTEQPRQPDTPPDCLVEAKFHGGPKSDEELAERYYWQIQHQLLVTGFRQAVLSVLRPGAYSLLPVARNETDIAVLLQTLQAFWWHVANDVAPQDPFAAIDPPRIERLKVLDMAPHNEFVSLGSTLMETRAASQAFREAEVALKALMPAHARVAFVAPSAGRDGLRRAGVVLTRARDGKLSLRFGDVPAQHRAAVEPWRPELLEGNHAGLPN
jgi:hypothetical protein